MILLMDMQDQFGSFAKDGDAIALQKIRRRNVDGMAGNRDGCTQNQEDDLRDQPACVIDTDYNAVRQLRRQHGADSKQHHYRGQRNDSQVCEDCDQRDVMLMQRQNRESRRPTDTAQTDCFTCPLRGFHQKSLPGPQQLMWKERVNLEWPEEQVAERPDGGQDRQHCDERKLKPYLKQLLGVM